jgi:hypothetical protein
VVRKVVPSELFAIWDYEGKYESKDWSPDLLSAVMNARLSSPPAKMLRSFAFTAGETALSFLTPEPSIPHTDPSSYSPGKTSDIPFNHMEEAISTRVKAAQADEAEVDLDQWAEEGETPEQANPREVLRRFVVKWWIYHQERLAK